MTSSLTLLLLAQGCSSPPEDPEIPVVETIDQLPLLSVQSPERGTFYNDDELRIRGIAKAEMPT